MIRNIVTIGGGNGSPVINEALLRTGRVNFISAITAVFDMGGATGTRRTDSRGQELAYSDPMRNMLSLVSPAKRDTDQYKALVELMTKRNWGKVLGQEIFAQFHQDGTGFDNVQKQLSGFTSIKFMGEVIPATTSSTNIVFSTASGRIYLGENQLDSHAMSKDMVKDMWLERSCDAYPQALEVIKKASVIIFSCGSLYGSVLCNTLPNGIKNALIASKAKIYLVTNLVSTRNETHNFKPKDFVRLLEKYAQVKLTGLIVPSISRKQFESKYSDVAFTYDLDHSHFLGWDDKELTSFVKKEKIDVIKHDATTIIQTQANEKTIRHDPAKLAQTLTNILS